jgi:hypothetical protein
MQHIAFLTYPVAEWPSALLWGFRIGDIGGTDLRCTPPTPPATSDARSTTGKPRPSRSFLLHQHDGLPLSHIGDPVRQFLGAPAPEFADPATGTIPVLAEDPLSGLREETMP